MNRISTGAAGLLAVLIACLSPLPVLASNLQFSNECRGAVIVQPSTVQFGRVRRDTPLLLRAGAVSSPISLDTDKIITVYDGANPNRVLFQGTLSPGSVDLYYSIVPDNLPNKVRMIRRMPP
jgi:hypothetical protein